MQHSPPQRTPTPKMLIATKISAGPLPRCQGTHAVTAVNSTLSDPLNFCLVFNDCSKKCMTGVSCLS